ncbi:penicillin acylase family protein [Nocardioides sp. AE5]|uniref:penicillin acylase family protein n=1 Tax=Nocardioides sp. AE5 TaxID=2962573 RepID=UPI002881CF56|nr:penicillin acylase family protein [Nocardioides sp. AE5]MDT0203972.1 penicillin acylase family protein [Nocardioides sp. AE5]
MHLRRRVRGSLLCAAAAVLVVPLLASGPGAADEPDPSGPRYSATITTTEHGIPHIVADDWGSLGFGSGYAAAGASTCTLADTLITGRGQRSLYFGEGTYDDQVAMNGTNLQVDALVTDLRNRKVVESLLADPVRGPSDRVKEMVEGYTAGLNQWLAETGPDGVTDPECRGAAYLATEATALDLWYGVYLANIMASTGHFTAQIVDAAPATLLDPGLPQVPGLPKVPTPQDLLDALAGLDQDALLAALGKDPAASFGSNATAVGGDKSANGRGMLLGNPHFPWLGRYRFTQQHLTIPGEYDVAGASLIGSPVVNIGFNSDVAWSHTVSTAYRFTPYEYVTLPGTLFYFGSKGLTKLEKRTVEVQVRQDDGTVATVNEDLYRTTEGYVIDAPDMLMPWGLATLWAIRDANAEQLRTLDTFLDMGGATDVADLIRRQDAGGGIPWVNTIAADRNGDVVYADHSVVPNVSNAKINRCLTPVGSLLLMAAGLPGLNGAMAGKQCAWGNEPGVRPGAMGPDDLPVTFRRDWVMNANDSYWLPNPAERLEGYSKIIGCEGCERSMRTRMVNAYPAEALADGGTLDFDEFSSFQFQNRVYAAEVMRVDGALDDACRAAGGTTACDVLAAWDGHSDADSVGTHIFEAFVERLPTSGVWEVPFSADDPLNTPRGLKRNDPKVVKAMAGALDELEADGVPLDAPWGSVQFAADRGAEGIGLGGGSHAAGNANVVASRNPADASAGSRPVTYGSSHMQAVTFTDAGVLARTLLSYGQYEDPTSPWTSDQTELYAAEQWVAFPFTPAEIAAQRVSTRVVTGG